MKYIPDFLSLLRLFLLPFAVLELARQDIVGGTIILAAMILTDLLDGNLARRLNSTSKFGAALDHGVDKIVSVTLAWVVMRFYGFPKWGFYLIVVREIAFVIGGFYIWKFKGVKPGSNWYGKIGGGILTASFYAYIVRFKYREQLLILAVWAIIIASFIYFWEAIRKINLTGGTHHAKEN